MFCCSCTVWGGLPCSFGRCRGRTIIALCCAIVAAVSPPEYQTAAVHACARRWANPLMGWTSSSDTLENVGRSSLFFYTKEEAMRFCEKHGWSYQVDEPNQRRTARQKRYNAYSDNFR